MNIGIIVFAYNRSQHLKKVLDGLKKNEGVSKVYIFQDGLKCEEHRSEWEKTHKVIKEIDWCKVIYNRSLYNKGLAKSIVDGINIVFKENDAVIVLEDDCVPTANFVSFMIQCFEKYKNDHRIYAVTGYSDPVNLPYSEFDIYGCGACPTWGWGTWKDRWSHYRIDNEILERLNINEDKSKYLATWGSHLTAMLVNRILGLNDSWAVYWGLNIIDNNGICINPYKSLIRNIGMDGTGVHCGVTDKFEVMISDGLKYEFKMPDQLEILHTTEVAYADYCGNYTAINIDKTKEHVLVYGVGKFYQKYEKEICNSYYVEAFIDRKKRKWYSGKNVICIEEISKYNCNKIIIMIQDIQECLNVIKVLISRGIMAQDIVLGHSLVGKYSETINNIKILQNGELLIDIEDTSIRVKSKEEFNKIYEVFVEKTYTYCINNDKRDIVLDVGVDVENISLYFAKQKNVDRVYAYDVSGKTVYAKMDSLKQNAVYEKAILYQTDTIELLEMIGTVVSRNSENNIILIIDYIEQKRNVLKELLKSDTLRKINFVLIEVLNKCDNDLIFGCLKEAQFSWWCWNRNDDSCLIHAYK